MTRNQKSMNIDFNIQQLKTEERREERKENEEKMKKEKELVEMGNQFLHCCQDWEEGKQREELLEIGEAT